MGTTRIKVVDLSSEQEQIKTSRKHAEKLTGVAKIKEEKKPKLGEERKEIIEKAITEGTQTSVPSKPSVPSEPSAPKVVKKPSPSHHTGKKYLLATKLVDKNKIYPAKEAIDLLYKTSITKFDPTVEVHLNVIDKSVKATVNFPHSIGDVKKTKQYLIFSNQKPATSNQQLIWGDGATIADIESGKLKPKRDFDQVYSTPKFMPQLAKLAKILGPAGMMPNPKNGTIIESDSKQFITSLDKSNQGTIIKTDPTAPIVHTKLGKLSAKPEQLEENLEALILGIGSTKIKKAFIKSTMSPAIMIDLSSLSK